jgi:hypothetical protein
MSYRLGNSIRLRSQTGLPALEDLHDSIDINRTWDNIPEDIKTSVKEMLGLYKLK